MYKYNLPWSSMVSYKCLTPLSIYHVLSEVSLTEKTWVPVKIFEMPQFSNKLHHILYWITHTLSPQGINITYYKVEAKPPAMRSLLPYNLLSWWTLSYLNSGFYQRSKRGHRGRDRMVVRFTTTYVISVYHHWCCEFEYRPGRGIQHYVIKFVRVFFHDIADILLNVALNTIKQTNIKKDQREILVC